MGGALVLAEAPVHFIFGALTGVPVPLLQASYQLVPFSLNAIEVVVSEIAPPFFDLSTHLFPFPFYNIGIHLLYLLIYSMGCAVRSTQGTAPSWHQEPLRRALHRTKSKMCARLPGCSPLPSLCSDAAQREYRNYRAMPSPPGTHVYGMIGPQSLLQSLSQSERDLSFRNWVIGMAAVRVLGGGVWTVLEELSSGASPQC